MQAACIMQRCQPATQALSNYMAGQVPEPAQFFLVTEQPELGRIRPSSS